MRKQNRDTLKAMIKDSSFIHDTQNGLSIAVYTAGGRAYMSASFTNRDVGDNFSRPRAREMNVGRILTLITKPHRFSNRHVNIEVRATIGNENARDIAEDMREALFEEDDITSYDTRTKQWNRIVEVFYANTLEISGLDKELIGA